MSSAGCCRRRRGRTWPVARGRPGADQRAAALGRGGRHRAGYDGRAAAESAVAASRSAATDAARHEGWFLSLSGRFRRVIVHEGRVAAAADGDRAPRSSSRPRRSRRYCARRGALAHQAQPGVDRRAAGNRPGNHRRQAAAEHHDQREIADGVDRRGDRAAMPLAAARPRSQMGSMGARTTAPAPPDRRIRRAAPVSR